MKRRIFILAVATVVALPVFARISLEQWQVKRQGFPNTPVLLDSADVKGTKYNPARIFFDAVPLPESNAAGFISIPADEQGIVWLGQGREPLDVASLRTRLSSPRFAKGNLEFSLPYPYEVYVDGKSEGKHEKGDTTILRIPVKFAPCVQKEIVIKALMQNSDSTPCELKAHWLPGEGFEDIELKQEGKRNFTLDDTMFGPRVSSVSLSPDGKWLLYSISDMVDADRKLQSFFLRNLRSGKNTPLPEAKGYLWHPGTGELTFKQKGANEDDLIALDPATLSQRTLARHIPSASLKWDRQGKYLYYIKEENPEESKSPVKRVSSPAERIPGAAGRSNLHRFDPATGIDIPLTFGSRQVSIADFHPGGDRVLLALYEETPTRRPFESIGFYELDTNTMKLDTIASPSGFLSDALYSPDGQKIALVAAPDYMDGLGAAYGRHPQGNIYDKQIYLLDRKSGATTCATLNFNPSVDGKPVWNSDGYIYFLADKGFDKPLFCLDPTTGIIKELPMPEGVEVLRSLSAPTDAPLLAFLGQGMEQAGGAWLLDLKKQRLTTVENPLASRLSEIEMAKGTPWNFTSSDGTEIEGWYFTPPGFDETKKYPVIVYYYGGTLPTQHGISSPYSPQVFASRGYVVYTLNPSGTVGYGQEFSARHCNAWGKRTAEDIIEGTQQFLDTHPWADAEKVGCIGASYGGFMTQYLQTLTPMFTAAVSHAGISDVTSYWGEGYWGYSYNAVAAPDSYPWSNPDLFSKQGSLWGADKIHTPLLLLHGTADTNVPIGESIQLYNALKILGRDVELVTVDGENHFIADYPKRRQWQDTIMAFFAKYLQDDPAWWQELYE